jgi:hypothetical protein
MDEQFEHPSADRLLREIRRLFESKTIFQRRDRPILFLCGGPIRRNAKNMRQRFLTWSKRNLPGLDIVLAEEAFGHTKFYDPPEIVNLSEFEELIASVADCVLVFPESAGSFAELGLFSGSGKCKQKILVANRVRYQAKDSFVNLGPVRSIDRSSYLKPAIHIGEFKGRPDFRPVKERLTRVLDRTHRKAFQYRPYSKLEYIGKLVVTLELIKIFHFVTLESLRFCMRAIFDSAKSKELKGILSILAGAGYIRFRDNFYFIHGEKKSLLEFENARIEDMQARVLEYYDKYREALYRQFKSAQNASR